MKIAYTAVFEQEPEGGWAAYVPDLPTVLASADTRTEAEQLIREGIELYLELLCEEGKPIHRQPSRRSRLKSSLTPERTCGTF